MHPYQENIVRKPFQEYRFKACRKLEPVHYDLCFPMSVPSTNGNKYLITFVYDYSRMCWVYLLKTKSKSFQTFNNYHAQIGNQAQAHIGTFHSNNGKGYMSNEFEDYI